MSSAKRVKIHSSYANIDWDKSSQFFQASPGEKEQGKYISTGKLLRSLARAADRGLMFIMHADNPAAVEYLLEGTGPLNWNTKLLVYRFQKQKYVKVTEESDGSLTVRITRNGLRRALTYQLNSLSLNAPKQWDHKWRLVLFDVPDKYKRMRDIFRSRLRQLGLYQLQKSAYISPYSCFDEIEFLRELYGIAFTVQYLLVEEIEGDAKLRRHFGLL